MKFRNTVFAHQLLSAVIGSLLLVASVAFVTLPASFSASQNDSQASTAQDWHLT